LFDAQWKKMMNRRDFLSVPPNKQEKPHAYWLHVNRIAMACCFEITLPVYEQSSIEIAQKALDEIDEIEDQLTVFRESSEISYINRQAAIEPVKVETRLFDLLQVARDLYLKTSGAFDITSGPLAKCWGFIRREGRIPDAGELDEALSVVGMDKLFLSIEEQTVRYSRPGMEINLGSIGKGYALDRVAISIKNAGIHSALITAGGSSMLALGDGEEADGWKVGIRHPIYKNKRMVILRLRDCATGTSGSEEQFFELNGKRYSHIIDPRTGVPAQGVISVTVTAQSATIADALATAFFVGGPELTERYCATHTGISALMLNENSDRPLLFGHNENCKVELL
jgi:FAD:protein FMN transferase